MVIVVRTVMAAVIGLAAVSRNAEELVVCSRIVRRTIAGRALIMIAHAETIRYALRKSGGNGIIQSTDGRVRVVPLRIVSIVVSVLDDVSQSDDKGNVVSNPVVDDPLRLRIEHRREAAV